jgi:hypothetical protein
LLAALQVRLQASRLLSNNSPTSAAPGCFCADLLHGGLDIQGLLQSSPPSCLLASLQKGVLIPGAAIWLWLLGPFWKLSTVAEIQPALFPALCIYMRNLDYQPGPCCGGRTPFRSVLRIPRLFIANVVSAGGAPQHEGQQSDLLLLLHLHLHLHVPTLSQHWMFSCTSTSNSQGRKATPCHHISVRDLRGSSRRLPRTRDRVKCRIHHEHGQYPQPLLTCWLAELQ